MTTAFAWDKIGKKNHHGLCLSLASLRSQNSCGIGEFLDLIPLATFCKEVGMDVLQLLPITDSGMDPSPYNAISSCALNPIYLNLQELKLASLKPELQKLQVLNQSLSVNYSEVLSLKMAYLRQYFEKEVLSSSPGEEFLEYCCQNPWLKNYGTFLALREKFPKTSWLDFPQKYQSPSPLLKEEFQDAIHFHSWVQYLCHAQLQKVRQAFESANVFLMGDIPILLSMQSVDVWENPSWFDLSLSAGAPPDPYNENGQSWGFPLYNWDEIEKSGFAFWKNRLKVASQFYDLFRLDHIVGFFRIWAIPPGKKAKEGFFVPSDTNAWIARGEKILKNLLSFSSMLPIGEDLGDIPEGVRPCMQHLGICGTKVVRWERFWEGDKNFIPLPSYPLLSVTYVSTHDSSTLAQWWESSPEEARLLASCLKIPYEPLLSEGTRFQILLQAHHSHSLFHINLLSEYLALVDPVFAQDRINVPGTSSPKNWSLRLKLDVETLATHTELKEKIRAITA